ncbi:MAG: Ig-like domain-containing protein, partial [Saprospiraceae bacterium]
QYVKVYASNPAVQYLNLSEVIVNGCIVSGSNIPPTVSIASPNSVYPVSASVTLNATASDADGTISNVQFYDGPALIGSKATSPYSIVVSNLAAGSHSITAKATDNGGAITTSSAINITISPATCNDGVQNGTETGIDCGGSCTACASGGGTQWSTASITQPTYHNGVVLIGKANVNTGSETGYNLFVVGGVKAEKFKVELQASGNWADYVFQKDYKLLPIRQLGSYIKEHHHLPNFPSVKDITLAGGYEMSDMIKRQQESIEQLHLYIIDLELQVQKVKGLEKRLAYIEGIIRK